MIQVFLADDQEIVRRGLKILLETKPDLQVIAEANNGQRAIQEIERLYSNSQPPDIVLMDIRMPEMDGIEATRLLFQQFPAIKILVLTTFDDSQYVAQALRHGAKGYLLKDMPADELAQAIRSVVKGYTQFAPGILEKIISNVSTSKPEETLPAGFSELTTREREVLAMITKGASNREIAQALFLSEGTVRNHITHILTRLNLRDRTQAALIAKPFLSWLEIPSIL